MASTRISELVDRFESHIESYRSGDYKEAQLRNEFIDPLFIELGWDVHNEKGYAEAYKDVIHEDAIKVGGAMKAPDYCFRIGGIRKFFVETKKPAVNIKDDISAAYQLRRYAWSAKLPLSILTDFEEFAIYDCRVKPNKNDSASTARTRILRYPDYIDKWEELTSIFSKDAILKGSFDKYVETKKRMRGTAEVDGAFLKEIEEWRENLARNIALRNSGLGVRDLNYAVQKTVDRIIFLRICEDRGIETYGQLRSLMNGSNVYKRLCAIYRNADDKYNSGLFYFDKEKDISEPPDGLTLGLQIDDGTLKQIIRSIYYPESPYEFSVLPADILGHVYEQFLGKVIRLTPGHHAKVEEKPEVRKAGGVYYTPTYIVDYIVKNTVGKLLANKTPNQATKLTILDPACGSGSFLLGAYQFLLHWYLEQYVNSDPEKRAKGKKPAIYRDQHGEWRLTTTERKRILLNNIYGVDIDPQAVEVTKLSLLLKVLEGESEETLGRQQKWFKERALPNLGDNIKCGNSLIGPDFYEGKQTSIFDEEEVYRINAFDWEKEFPAIMAGGGFDAVIGNPPYVQASHFIEIKDYLDRHYTTFTPSGDLYTYFIERSIRLLSQAGMYAMIVSNKWIRADYGRKLRNFLPKNINIHCIIDFGELPVFRNVGSFPCIIIASKTDGKKIVSRFSAIKRLPPLGKMEEQLHIHGFDLDYSSLDPQNWILANNKVIQTMEKIKQDGIPINKINALKIRRGVVTGCNNAFIIDEKTKKRLVTENKSAREIIFPFVSGKETRRYALSSLKRHIIFTKRGIDINDYPSVSNHLSTWRKKLEPKKNRREKTGRKPGNYKWYEIQDTTEYYMDFKKPKIIFGQFQIAPHFAFSDQPLFFGSNHYMIVHENVDLLHYLLAILNSDLYFFYMKHRTGVLGNADMRGRLISQKSHFIEFPVHICDISKATEELSFRRMIDLVKRMLSLYNEFANMKTEHEKTVLQRQIKATDHQIDQLVYELYGLTEEEIKIVEEGGTQEKAGSR